MKILVVEDNYNKVQKIHEIFREGLKPVIKSVVSSFTAKELMKQEKYDLLIVDVQIPDLEGGEISLTGGVDLLAFIEASNDIKVPSFIMGVTSFSKDFESIKREFESFGWPLFRTNEDFKIWSNILNRKYHGNLNNIHNFKADIALITALEHTELEAVINLPIEWSRNIIDGFAYQFGEIETPAGRKLKLVAAASERMGVSAASSLATRIALLFKPKFMVMTGICAGVKGKVNLGDIVVADHVWDWGSGKISEKDGEVKFLPEPHQIPLHRAHRNIIKSFSVHCPYLEEIYLGWTGKRSSKKPKLHLAPMACGSQVIANTSIMDQILEGNRKMLALEMESYGFLNACESIGISGLVIKSVCDYADSEKSDDSHEYAAYTSASFALHYITNNIDSLE